MALSLDGSAANTGIGVSSGTVTLSTSLTNDVIVLWVVTGLVGTVVTVSTVSGGGLTWNFRKRTGSYASGAATQNIEEWWAIAPAALSSTVITANFSGSCNFTMVAFGVNGADQGSPFDSNASLPAAGTGGAGTTPALTGVSTNNKNTMMIAICSNNSGSSPAVGSGYTQIQAFGTTEVGNSEFQIFSSIQSGVTVGFGATTVAAWGEIADALQIPGTFVPYTLTPQLGPIQAQ